METGKTDAVPRHRDIKDILAKKSSNGFHNDHFSPPKNDTITTSGGGVTLTVNGTNGRISHEAHGEKNTEDTEG